MTGKALRFAGRGRDPALSKFRHGAVGNPTCGSSHSLPLYREESTTVTAHRRGRYFMTPPGVRDTVNMPIRCAKSYLLGRGTRIRTERSVTIIGIAAFAVFFAATAVMFHIVRDVHGGLRASEARAASLITGRGGGQPFHGSALDSIHYVIHVSVDGLRPDAVSDMGAENVPNLFRMRVAGIFTDNARSDYDFTNTLPNHVCQLTSRHVNGAEGHNVDFNSDNGGTLEEAHGAYVAGVFDVVHDHGLRTGMYVSKSKFAFLERSWNDVNGEPDTVGTDNGRDKIDVYLYLSDTDALVDSFLVHTIAAPQNYSFIHLMDPDAVGHASGWNSGPYYDTVIEMDGLIGRIFDFLDTAAVFSGRTAVIVTSDHGGLGTNHSDPTIPENYTVPFYVWGPGIPAGADCYWLNQTSRDDPGGGRPDQAAVPQPIRNGDVANLTLYLLDLPAIPGSVINAAQDLTVCPAWGNGKLPDVAILSPEDGSVFEIIASIQIEATAAVDGGSITIVEFFSNWEKLGEDDTYPYTYTWSEAPLGDHRIAARAWTNDSLASTASVDVEVTGTTPVDDVWRRTVPSRVFPNPFGYTARIEFIVAREAWIKLEVFDCLGRRVDVHFDRRFGVGRHVEGIDCRFLAPGVYFYRLMERRDSSFGEEVVSPKGECISAGKFMILR